MRQRPLGGDRPVISSCYSGVSVWVPPSRRKWQRRFGERTNGVAIRTRIDTLRETPQRGHPLRE